MHCGSYIFTMFSDMREFYSDMREIELPSKTPSAEVSVSRGRVGRVGAAKILQYQVTNFRAG